jgi:hypothetical protein
MENQTNLKWYQKPSGTIILLILFFPVGLYLMWKNKLWTKNTRWIVTGVFALFVIANAGKNNSNDHSDNGNSNGNNTEQNQLSDSEKKIMCLRMYGGGDLSAWETAQAECMLNNSESACDCMQILSK